MEPKKCQRIQVCNPDKRSSVKSLFLAIATQARVIGTSWMNPCFQKGPNQVSNNCYIGLYLDNENHWLQYEPEP